MTTTSQSCLLSTKTHAHAAADNTKTHAHAAAAKTHAAAAVIFFLTLPTLCQSSHSTNRQTDI